LLPPSPSKRPIQSSNTQTSRRLSSTHPTQVCLQEQSDKAADIKATEATEATEAKEAKEAKEGKNMTFPSKVLLRLLEVSKSHGISPLLLARAYVLIWGIACSRPDGQSRGKRL
jgi:hypothetical protein